MLLQECHRVSCLSGPLAKKKKSWRQSPAFDSCCCKRAFSERKSCHGCIWLKLVVEDRGQVLGATVPGCTLLFLSRSSCFSCLGFIAAVFAGDVRRSRSSWTLNCAAELALRSLPPPSPSLVNCCQLEIHGAFKGP